MIGVWTDEPCYRTAVAELPVTACLAEAMSGAVVALGGGAGWARRAIDAVTAGAVAVIVRDPRVACEADLAELAALSVPLVLDRARVRADIVQDALGGGGADAGAGSTAGVGRARPGLLTAACTASPSSLEETLRDALGWLRELAGSPLVLREHRSTGNGALAVLTAPARAGEAEAAATLLATVVSSGPREGSLSAIAVGQTRTEVEVRGRGVASVVVTSSRGATRLPERFEERARLSVRRAIEALASDAPPTDLAGFRHDAAGASALVAGRHGHPLVEKRPKFG